jgi:hypothetical protein
MQQENEPPPADGWPDDHAGWVTLTELGSWAGVEFADDLDPSPYQVGGFPWDEVVQHGDRALYVPLDSAVTPGSRSGLSALAARRCAVLLLRWPGWAWWRKASGGKTVSGRRRAPGWLNEAGSAGKPANPAEVPSCGGRYHADGHPGVLQRTTR